MELFSHSVNQASLQGVPLAERLRPKVLEDFVGQVKALGKGTPLRREIESARIPSLILWGPPGCGKTTLAHILATVVKGEFITAHAVETGAKALKELSTLGKNNLLMYQKQTVVFIDEIHRLNKAQQDVLLPSVERGEIVLIGATTENPSFEINSALLSRCRLVVFERLQEQDLLLLLERAAKFTKKIVSDVLEEEAKERILSLADGDGRRLLNLMEIALGVAEAKGAPLAVKDLEEALAATPLYYDKKGDQHYDTVSAFIKSIRGSDPDAGLYYLARMLEGGEDPVFIARRLVILASEDVGNGDPRALTLAVSTAQAVQLIGLPEAAINLAQAVTYLASAPKSNASYRGLRRAQQEVRETGMKPVPHHLRNAPTKTMKDLGFGAGYQYAHDHDKGWADQDHLPKGLKNRVFYEPIERGFEKNIRQYLEWLKNKN